MTWADFMTSLEAMFRPVIFRRTFPSPMIEKRWAVMTFLKFKMIDFLVRMKKVNNNVNNTWEQV